MIRVFKGLILLLVLFVFASSSVSAIDLFGDVCKDYPNDPTCQSTVTTDARGDAGAKIKNVVDTLMYIIGIVSVIVIVYGGFRYVVAGGDTNSVSEAKNIILYAVIGLFVALAGYAIVNFVVTNLG